MPEGPSYRVVLARSAERELERLPDRLLARVVSVLDGLAVEPRPDGCRKLRAVRPAAWRVRVGDHRVVYRVDDAERMVDVVAIRHRRDAYR